MIACDGALAAYGVAPLRQLRLLLRNLLEDVRLRSALLQWWLINLALLVRTQYAIVQKTFDFLFFGLLEREELERPVGLVFVALGRQGTVDSVQFSFDGQLVHLKLWPRFELPNSNLLAHVADHSLTALIAIALKVNALARYRVHILKIMKRALIMILWQCLALHALGLERLLDHIHDPIDTMVVITGCILILRCILQFVATKCQSL